MVDFATAIHAVTAGVGAVKELRQLGKTYDEALLKLKIAELSSALATAQITLAEAQTDSQKKGNSQAVRQLAVR